MTNEEKWLSNFNDVKMYIEKNGRLPSNKDKIGMWLDHQRQSYKGIGGCKMTPNRISLLESLPNWYWTFNDKWNSTFNEVKEFIETNGRLPKHNEQLNSWVSSQRQLYKDKGKLTTEQIELLESIKGWSWNNLHNDRWNEKFNEVKQFVDENNRLPKLNEQNKCWINTQKQIYKGTSKGRLTTEQIKLLESLKHWEWSKSIKVNK